MNRELSGHAVKVMPFITYKWDPKGTNEVRLQGSVMARANQKELWNRQPIAPTVWALTPNGYLMSTRKSLAGEWRWRNARNALASCVWNRREEELLPGNVPFSASGLYVQLELLLPSYLRSFIPAVGWFQSKYGRSREATHGDPTHENTLLNGDGSYCFIDWQPFRLSIRPASRDVDYGRLLQSVLGWRSILHISDDLLREVDAIWLECPMAWFWCAINFTRIKMRAPNNPELHAFCDQRLEFLSYCKRRIG